VLIIIDFDFYFLSLLLFFFFCFLERREAYEESDDEDEDEFDELEVDTFRFFFRDSTFSHFSIIHLVIDELSQYPCKHCLNFYSMFRNRFLCLRLIHQIDFYNSIF